MTNEGDGDPGRALPPGPPPGTGRRPRARLFLLLGDVLAIPLLAVGLLAGIIVVALAAGMPLDAGNARALLEGENLPAAAVGRDASAFPLAALASLPLALLAWTLLAGRRQIRGRFRVDRGVLGTGVLGGAGMLAIGAVGSLVTGAGSPAAFAVMRATHPAIVVPLLVVLAPLGEELYLRGRLYGLLEEGAGRPWAYGVSAAVFALLHLAGGLDYLPLVLSYAGIGLLLARLRDRSGGLVAPLVAHALNNLAGALALYLAPPS